MRNHYLRLLERELERLWISPMTVCVLKLGKDKFTITDGRRFSKGKGHQLYRAVKTLPDKAGYERFWNALKRVDYSENKHAVIVIDTADAK